jgi:hypothetical protein
MHGSWYKELSTSSLRFVRHRLYGLLLLFRRTRSACGASTAPTVTTSLSTTCTLQGGTRVWGTSLAERHGWSALAPLVSEFARPAAAWNSVLAAAAWQRQGCAPCSGAAVQLLAQSNGCASCFVHVAALHIRAALLVGLFSHG